MGIPIFGALAKPLVNTLAVIGTGIFIAAAYSAIFTLIATLITSKPVTVIACIFICMAIYFGSMMISMKLEEPEFYSGNVWIENGIAESDLLYPNPFYLRGTKRAIYEFIYDFLPAGQGFQLARENAVPKAGFPLYSLFITVITTTGGILIFRRKDLK